jgi:F0F1-type ATP synthase membrane subunit c/vacuolar-type H+-ATPase subunit K
MSTAGYIGLGFVLSASLMLLFGVIGSAIGDDLSVAGAQDALEQHPEESRSILRDLFAGMVRSEFVALLSVIGALALLFATPGRSMLAHLLGI